MRTKRLICMLLTICMLLSLMPAAAFAVEVDSEMPFTDVKESDWFYDAVQYVYDNGLMNGTGDDKFSPNLTITRGMIVTILHRLEGTPEAEGKAFADVPKGEYYSAAVAWASFAKIVEGYDTGLFAPNDAITREQMATILYRYVQYKGYSATEAGDLSGFPDGGDVSSFALKAVKWAVGEKLIKGADGGMLMPAGTATRAQAATILMRFCEGVVPKTHTVTFDFNYDGKIAIVSALEGETIEEPAAPERADFTFGGWYTDADGKTAYDFNKAITEDVTLYAKWTANEPAPTPELPKTYTVSFDYNYDEMGVYKEVAVEEGKTVGEPEAPSRSMYIFLGWTADKNGGQSFDFSTPITSDITLYAQWRIYHIPTRPTTKTYTVTFESNGGSEVASQTVEKGGQVEEPEAPIKDNYIFEGWYTDSELTSRYDFSSAVRNNIILYAKYMESSEDRGLVTGSDSSVDVFFISELKINKETGNAVAVVSAPENCALVVRFVDEDIYFSEEYPSNKVYISDSSLYASHVVRAESNTEEIVAEISGVLPEYYVAEAVLVDGDGNLLCNPFSSIEHTKRYEEYKQKTADDFDEIDTVLKFGQETNNNFGVLADDVRVINVQSIDFDENNNTYYLTEVTESIDIGDKLLVDDGTERVLIKVKEVTNIEEGASQIIMVVPASADDEEYGFTLDEFYKYIKVDKECEVEVKPVDAEKNKNYVATMAVDIIDEDISGNTTLDINPITIETDHFSASVKFGGSINGNLVMQYDIVLFGKDYMRCDFIYSTDLHANLDIVGNWGTENNEELKEALENEKVEKELRLGKVRIPFGVTGLDAFADIKACIEWKITAGVELDGNIETTHGFKYNTKDGHQKIDKKEFAWSIDGKGHAEISFGPKPSVGVEFLNGVISCGLECFFGAKAEADLVRPLLQGGSSKHACSLCIDGNVKKVISVDGKLKYEISDHFKGTPIDLKIVNIEKLMFDFYISLINSPDSVFGGNVKFGKGSCPNQVFKTELFVRDENDDIYSATVTITAKSDGAHIADVESGDSVYLYDGNYVASTKIGSNAISRTFTISGEPQKISLTNSTCDGSISGVVKDATSKTGIENAIVSVYKNGVLCADAKTSADGSYSVSLSEGSYKYIISAEGYVSASGYVSINDGETKYMEKTLMAKDNDKSIMGGIYGTIRDAHTGAPISGVEVRIYLGSDNTTGVSPATDIIAITNSEGEYAYKQWSVFGVTFGLPAGNYTAVLTKDGYITTSFNLVVVAGVDTEFDSSISPVASEDEYRVVLTWGENPSDLDSHYIAVMNDGNTDHVYFNNETGSSANLDLDDISSYGPETITVTEFGDLKNGFTYAVHDYSNRSSDNSTSLSESGAIIKLYKGATLLRTYNVPTSKTGTVWNVFAVDKNGNITDINTFDNVSDPKNVGNINSYVAAVAKNSAIDTQKLKPYELSVA